MEKIVESKLQPLIELKSVNLGYGNHVILSDLDLTINHGEYVGIIGPNGSGKTTFLRAILGLILPLNGQIVIDGKPLDKKAKNKIGYVPQNIKIDKEFPLSVKEAVLMGRYPQIGVLRVPRKQDKDAVQKALHQVHMEQYKDRPIGHLSGGEQQKIMIARALARQPEMLLLDEPTSALDFQMTQSVFTLVHELNQKYNLTIVMVHHNVELIRKSCHRLIIFDETIRFDGNPQDERADQIINIAYNIT